MAAQMPQCKSEKKKKSVGLEMPKGGGGSNPISISKLVPNSHWCGWERFIKDIESKRKEAMQCNAMLRLGEGIL